MNTDTRGSTASHHLTRIIATLGPASDSDDGVLTLIQAGTNIFRLNFSHGTYEQHAASVERIRRISALEGKITAILQDIPGPKLRIGEFAEETVSVSEGQEFTLWVGTDNKGDSSGVGFEREGWHSSIKPGERVLLGDGNMELNVVSVSDDSILTTVGNSGEIRSRQGLNFPDTDLELGAVTDEDWDHIAFGLELGVDAIALSFVQGPEDLIEVRRFIQRKGDGPLLIAKIETPKAVENILEIIEQSDGVMVARGDLGITLPIERVPVIQKYLIQLAREQRRFVITATQMLESMTQAARPTRAEATDVANAVYDGTDAVMLSGETAIGRHPSTVVETMRRILTATEPSVKFPSMERIDESVDSAVSRAVKQLADELEAKAILAPISSGSTALRLSRQRMGVPILVGTLNDTLARRMVFYQSVFPMIVDPELGLKKTSECVIQNALDAGYITNGDRVLLSGGLPVEKAGTTNFIRALTVGDEI
ncbi:pyruvate kinase [bacterium BMS3Bbin04]|nr:pyruvate kinase [bacterium BMS3Bbin04]